MTVPHHERRPLWRDWRAWVVAVFLAGIVADIVVLIVNAVLGNVGNASNAGAALIGIVFGGAVLFAPYALGVWHGRNHASQRQLGEIRAALDLVTQQAHHAIAETFAVKQQMNQNFTQLHKAVLAEIQESAQRTERLLDTVTRIEQLIPGSPVRRIRADHEKVE